MKLNKRFKNHHWEILQLKAICMFLDISSDHEKEQPSDAWPTTWKTYLPSWEDCLRLFIFFVKFSWQESWNQPLDWRLSANCTFWRHPSPPLPNLLQGKVKWRRSKSRWLTTSKASKIRQKAKKTCFRSNGPQASEWKLCAANSSNASFRVWTEAASTESTIRAAEPSAKRLIWLM